MDREYEVLEYISSSDEVTQREISEHLGISLGSVNLLLKKMIKEGFIKIEKIPANRVAYMLTPKGMQEKIVKTVSYIKHHYSAIEKMKSNIMKFLETLEYELVLVFTEKNEACIILEQVIKEMNLENVKMIDKIQEDRVYNEVLIVTTIDSMNKLSQHGAKVINILDII